MAYEGNIATVQLGQLGLYTDDPQTITPPNALIKTNNIQYTFGSIEKAPGSLRYNSNNVLPAGVGAFLDWWPDTISQRLIVACKDGKIYKFNTPLAAFSEVTPQTGAPATLLINNQTVMISGGAEALGKPNRIFIFTGRDTPQVIDGDTGTRRNMTSPAADWTGTNQPTFGIIHRQHLFAFGNKNLPHQVYISNGVDHEDFTSTSSLTASVYPGSAEKLVSGFVYKNVLYLVKYPFGLYQLIDTDPNPTNWYFVEIQNELGGASAHCVAPIINDMWIANSNGGLSSITQVNNFGQIKSGDIFNQLRNQQFIRQNTSQQGIANRHMIWYGDKLTILAAYQSAGNFKNDLLCYIDLNSPNGPRVSWSDKDQPNCLGLIKDVQGIQRPAYGSDDGYVYLLDRADRSINGAGYIGEFQTSYNDFSGVTLNALTPSNLAQLNKIYDFLEVVYEPTGDFDLSVDVFIDGVFKKTLTFNLSSKANLESLKLDSSTLDFGAPRESRRPINLQGRRISFRCYNSGVNQNFKITRLVIYFRMSDQAQKPVGGP